MQQPAELLESRIGYFFQDRTLLLRALTHKSWIGDQPPNPSPSLHDNEQLEFLGDAVLGFLASDHLIRRFPNYSEGKLTPLRATMVNRFRLYHVAHRTGIGEFLRLGRGEERSGGRTKRALLANCMEALLGAVYLDGGIDACRRVLEQLNFFEVADSGAGGPEVPQDAKGALQSYAQVRKLAMPRYVVVEEKGPVHARIFIVEARLGKDLTAQAEGTSKKAASLRAAENLMEKIRTEGLDPSTFSEADPAVAPAPEPPR